MRHGVSTRLPSLGRQKTSSQSVPRKRKHSSQSSKSSSKSSSCGRGNPQCLFDDAYPSQTESSVGGLRARQTLGSSSSQQSERGSKQLQAAQALAGISRTAVQTHKEKTKEKIYPPCVTFEKRESANHGVSCAEKPNLVV